tara:strand:- start:1408 stop:1719 length:312 start_codon:yes stop_codon:yes gene_type:complete
MSYNGEWEEYYGSKTIKEGCIVISGGGDNWSEYILEFSRSNDEFPKDWNYKLYKDCILGRFSLDKKILVSKKYEEQVKLVGREYILKENEMFIDYDYFDWSDN